MADEVRTEKDDTAPAAPAEDAAAVAATTGSGTGAGAMSADKPPAQAQAEDALARVKNDEINAFVAVNIALKSMREALEDPQGQPPRWVRIVRVNEGTLEWSKRPIGAAVREAGGGFLYAIGVVSELTLKAIDLLTDIDGGKALVEVGVEMLTTLSSDEVARSIQYSVGMRKPEDDQEPNKKDFDNPLAPVATAMNTVESVLKYVPSPEDVHGVAYELYKLQAVVHSLVKTGETEDLAVDPQMTGKARLMSWGLERPIPVFLGGGLLDFRATNICYLGSRPVKDVSNPGGNAQNASLSFTYKSRDGIDESVNVYEYDYGSSAGPNAPPAPNTPPAPVEESPGTGDAVEAVPAVKDDLAELAAVLSDLGYRKADLKENLTDFQTLNEIVPANGILEVVTINRLMSLDSEKETLCRAIRNPETPA